MENSDPLVIQSVASLYTDCAIPVPVWAYTVFKVLCKATVFTDRPILSMVHCYILNTISLINMNAISSEFSLPAKVEA
jgi:hypothetical protein